MIPGVGVVWPREEWQDPAWPVVGPLVDARDITTAVIHYTAAPKIPADLFAFHRNMQHAYAKPRSQGGRGYSLGYRWSVASGGARDGEVFQIRGWQYKSAANLMHNDTTEPILVLVDGSDAATDKAAHAVRCIVAESGRRAGRLLAVKGHGQLRIETGAGTATSCPGVGLQAQINAGVFTPRPPVPPVVPPIPAEDFDMIAIDHKPGTPEWTAMIYNGCHLAHVRDGHADSVLRRAGVPRQTVTDAELDGLIRSATTTTPVPWTFVNTARGAMWTASRG